MFSSVQLTAVCDNNIYWCAYVQCVIYVTSTKNHVNFNDWGVSLTIINDKVVHPSLLYASKSSISLSQSSSFLQFDGWLSVKVIWFIWQTDMVNSTISSYSGPRTYGKAAAIASNLMSSSSQGQKYRINTNICAEYHYIKSYLIALNEEMLKTIDRYICFLTFFTHIAQSLSS